MKHRGFHTVVSDLNWRKRNKNQMDLKKKVGEEKNGGK